MFHVLLGQIETDLLSKRMKKTEAIRRAREIIPAPLSRSPTHFIVRVPIDFQRPQSGFNEVLAHDYFDAHHARAYAICRLALAYMGLEHVPLSREDGGTVEKLMAKALDRAMHGCEPDDAPLAFWRVNLCPSSLDGE